jgi:hypothetical protein
MTNEELYDKLHHLIAEAINDRLGGKQGFLTYDDAEHHAGIALDAIWPEIEKYQKFVAAVIELGPDGVAGLVEYLGAES